MSDFLSPHHIYKPGISSQIKNNTTNAGTVVDAIQVCGKGSNSEVERSTEVIPKPIFLL
jgi:hypothetical protein